MCQKSAKIGQKGKIEQVCSKWPEFHQKAKNVSQKNRPKSAKNEKLNKYTQNDRNFTKKPKMSKFFEKCAKNRPKSVKIAHKWKIEQVYSKWPEFHQKAKNVNFFWKMCQLECLAGLGVQGSGWGGEGQATGKRHGGGWTLHFGESCGPSKEKSLALF